MTKNAADSRGYVGAERRRVLTPAHVAWARDASFRGATAPAIRQALAGVGIDLGIESVRRMLRGETYGNVGRKLPERLVAPEIPPPPGLVPETEVSESAERLRKALAEGPDALERLAADVQQARAGSADALLTELASGRNPFEALPAGQGPGPTQRDSSGPTQGRDDPAAPQEPQP